MLFTIAIIIISNLPTIDRMPEELHEKYSLHNLIKEGFEIIFPQFISAVYHSLFIDIFIQNQSMINSHFPVLIIIW